jgi:hypothetical protein
MTAIDTTRKVTKLLGGVDDRVIECRGDHHLWPPLWRKGAVPRGTRYQPSEVQGVYFVHQDCQNCTRWREKLMAAGERWVYGGGLRDFSAEPFSDRAELSKADYRNELYRRINEYLVRGA